MPQYSLHKIKFNSFQLKSNYGEKGEYAYENSKQGRTLGTVRQKGSRIGQNVKIWN